MGHRIRMGVIGHELNRSYPKMIHPMSKNIYEARNLRNGQRLVFKRNICIFDFDSVKKIVKKRKKGWGDRERKKSFRKPFHADYDCLMQMSLRGCLFWNEHQELSGIAICMQLQLF